MADVQAQEAANVNNEQQQQQQEQPRQSAFEIFKSIATRMLVMYLVMNGVNYFKSRPSDTSNPTSNSPSATSIGGNMFAPGSKFDMYVYISESDSLTLSNDEERSLIWQMDEIGYGDWTSGPNNDGTYSIQSKINVTQTMAHNGSIYLHVFMTEHSKSTRNSNDINESNSKRTTFSTFKRLNKYSKKVYKKTKNLITGDTVKDAEYQVKADNNIIEILSYWHPNLTINLIDDHTPWQKNAVPPPINDFIEFDALSGKYYPVIYLNDYWNLNSDYYPINSTLSHLDLHLTFAPLQLWKWQLYLSQSTRNQFLGGVLQEDSNEDDQDTMKRTLVETSPYLLALTVIVTLVHNVFEFLAFKNDIQFWRNRKSLEGLSVNSVLFGCLTQLIVLLYVLDNDTNTIVKISIGIGLLIELWKVPKVVSIQFDHENKLLGVLPRLKLIYKVSYVKSNTQDFDKLAFKYLSWILFPLVVGYSVYSLMYNEHKGWYSFVLNMLYGFLLTFGFIMMTPQLFINYKLKSVAHLPWRMLTYKALNTFIDDIFAFIIKMPTMYRLGCLRDDIIFFIYLYQRYIYKVDKKRCNEFGSSGEELTPDGTSALEQTNQLNHLKEE